jgi:hypothetical protein
MLANFNMTGEVPFADGFLSQMQKHYGAEGRHDGMQEMRPQDAQDIEGADGF